MTKIGSMRQAGKHGTLREGERERGEPGVSWGTIEQNHPLPVFPLAERDRTFCFLDAPFSLPSPSSTPSSVFLLSSRTTSHPVLPLLLSSFHCSPRCTGCRVANRPIPTDKHPRIECFPVVSSRRSPSLGQARQVRVPENPACPDGWLPSEKLAFPTFLCRDGRFKSNSQDHQRDEKLRCPIFRNFAFTIAVTGRSRSLCRSFTDKRST